MSDLRHGQILTPQDRPEHWVIGKLFRGPWGTVYYCDSYEHPMGYWMTEVDNDANRRNVSDRAIGRTFHEVHDDPMFTPKFTARAWGTTPEGRKIAFVVMQWEPWNLLGRKVEFDGKVYRILKIDGTDTRSFRDGHTVQFHLKDLDS